MVIRFGKELIYIYGILLKFFSVKSCKNAWPVRSEEKYMGREETMNSYEYLDKLIAQKRAFVEENSRLIRSLEKSKHRFALRAYILRLYKRVEEEQENLDILLSRRK